ncbi:SDR family NAD(P)-dependent oxidoreductase [Alkalihalobacillus sp. AL-G]|uniref:SDR family NAD(P)-dependent oxidoreductase n=1 Tax=Alkalihalobacillus sp. AL-G TaxID=2926399 RepID=UPI00272CAC92|nr:SDR family oxidoreductase [Alkalihalobacillus sp. AL-G]WLD94746.1 SDR family oxidoreductase [Alkalihalobacillus sp. AL-G]
MNINLKGKNAVITGSTTGIGFAIAESLSSAGASVLVNGKSEINVEEAVDQLQATNPTGEVTGVVADLGDPSGVQKVIEHWAEADILVNNLGLFEVKPFFEISDEDWEEYFQVNVMAAIRLTRHYAKRMVDNGWGRVLFNSSTVSGFFEGEMVHFGATKAALLATSRGLAESLAGTGVTVNAFLPGPTKTERVGEFVEGLARESDTTVKEMEEKMFAGLPSSLLKRFIEPREVANLVTFLASEEASAITGAAMRADGGIVRSLL